MKKLLLWGSGAHAGNIFVTLQRLPQPSFTDIALITDQPESVTGLLRDVPCLGNRRILKELSPAEYAVFPAVGMPPERKQMMNYLEPLGFEIPTLIDPSAVIEPEVEIGVGCLIRSYGMIGYQAQLGDGVLLNAGAQISHECQIGAYSSLFSGSRVLGRARLETGVLLGANATIAPGLKVGAWSRISMGSTVLQDLPAYVTAVGNPARIVKQYPGPPPAELLPLPHA